MKIEDKNDLNIVFFAFRYALGRKTGAVPMVINKVKELWDEFPLHDKEQFLSETKRYCDMELGSVVTPSTWDNSKYWYDFQYWCANKIREEKIDEIID